MSGETCALADRRVLIAGGSGGIGGAIAKRLAAEGARIVLIGQDERKLTATERVLAPLSHHAIETRVGDLGELSFLETITNDPVPIDAVVHAAGIAIPEPLLEADPHNFSRMLQINLWSVMTLTMLAARKMKRQGGGDIVAVGSGLARGVAPNVAGYAATKHGLAGFLKCARLELAPHAIRVIEIAPGYVESTDFHRHASHPALQGRFSERPYQAIRPEDVATCVSMALNLPRNAEITMLEVRSSGHAYLA